MSDIAAAVVMVSVWSCIAALVGLLAHLRMRHVEGRSGAPALPPDELPLLLMAETAAATRCSGVSLARRLLLGLSLAAVGCGGVAVPPPRGQALSTFTDDAALRAFLFAVARARPERLVERGVLSEAGGSRPYEHAVPRVTPWLSPATTAAVEPARSMLVSGGAIWATRQRGVARASSQGAALAAEAGAPLPIGTTSIEPSGLLALDGAVAAVARNDCGGITLARYVSTGGAPAESGALRLCGKLVSQPWIARAGGDVLAYVVFDPIEDPAGTITLPTAQPAGRGAYALSDLGPVYYPVRREADVLLRVLLRCDADLRTCHAHTFVSPRAPIDALWADAERFAVAFSKDADATVYILPSPAGAPRFAEASGWAFGIVGLGDGRFSLLRSSLPMAAPRSAPAPSVAAIDIHGRVADGAVLPAPVSGKDGSWAWAVHEGWMVYGPSRTHNLGGADVPRAFVAQIPGGPVDARPIAPSVDVALFAGGEAILVGADGKGVKTVVHRMLAEPGPWREEPYSREWSLAAPELDRAEGTMFVQVGDRRLLIVPLPDMTYSARYRLVVLELGRDGLRKRGTFATIAGGPSGENHLDAMALDGRLLLRLPNELVLVELDGEVAREVARLPLGDG